VDIVTYLGSQAKGGHHTILYGVSAKQAPGTHECTEGDMFHVHYVGGGGTDATIAASKIPPGLAFRIPEGQQLMLLSHWINAGTQTVQAQAAYTLTVQDPSPGITPADLFTVVTTGFKLPPGHGTAHTECVMKQDMQFFVVGGHAHEYATQVTVSVAPNGQKDAQKVYDQVWGPQLIFDTPLEQFTKNAPLTFHAGDTVNVDCVYENTTGAPISFPTEMCVGFGYFFPATNEIDCVDGQWSGG
jgi:hypothetical protein